MKHLIFPVVFLWFAGNLFSQEKSFYEVAKSQEAVYVSLIEYADPEFPECSTSDNPMQDKSYMFKLESYAKFHPPCPLIRNTGNPDLDKAQWQEQTIKWSQQYSFFPRYIPYHLFNRLLTPEDDLLIYQTAVNVWLEKNAGKIEEIKK